MKYYHIKNNFNFLFLFPEPNYPQQVLALDLSGSRYVGEDVGINQDLGIPSPGPIAVDTIRRIVYWYTQSDNLIYSRSLGSGDLQVGEGGG